MEQIYSQIRMRQKLFSVSSLAFKVWVFQVDQLFVWLHTLTQRCIQIQHIISNIYTHFQT